MKIAITGAAGYLGKQIINKLIENSEVESIIAIDRIRIPITNNKVKSFTCDITSPRIAQIISGCSVVVHLAFIIGDSSNRPALYRINIDGSRNVFESAAQAEVKKLIATSSIAVYGYYPDNPDIIDENTPLRGNPNNAYTDTKRLVELLLDDFEKRYPDIGVIRFRPGVILGPNTRNSFRTMMELPFWIDFKGDGTGFFSRAAVIHEEDLADAFLLGIMGNQRGAYNLAVEPFVSKDEILARTHQIPISLPARIFSPLMDITFKLKISNSPASDLLYALYPIPASGQKAIKELGWQPKYSGLEAVEGLLENIKCERKNKPLLNISEIISRLPKR